MVGLGFLFFATVNSHADLFSDTVDFSGTVKSDGFEYLESGGIGTPCVFTITHDVTFTSPAAAVTSAQIVLTHHSDSNNPGELWFLYDSGSTMLGELRNSTKGVSWVDQVFTLPPEIYSGINGGSWSLELKLREDTTGTDKVQIAHSVLSGTYTPVPLPAPILLFGSGLGGLAFFRRKRVQSNGAVKLR